MLLCSAARVHAGASLPCSGFSLFLPTNSGLPSLTDVLFRFRKVQEVIFFFFLLRLCLGAFSFLPPSLSLASCLSTAELSSSTLAVLLALAVMRNRHLLQALLSVPVPGRWLLWAHAVCAALVLLALLAAACFITFFLIYPV